jgi:hypothetical protein
MSAPPARRRRPWRVVALLIALAVFATYIVIGSLSSVQTECALCVTFRGQTQCRTGSGASTQDAQRAAQKAACGVMAQGMDATIECENIPPTNVQCPPR